MAVADVVRLSLFDRLIDDEPGDSRDRIPSAAQAMASIRDSVGRDLQALLNTRRRPGSAQFGGSDELGSSLLNYGLPDLHGMGLGFHQRDQLRRIIHEAISRYMPVFSSLQVVVLENIDPLDRAMRFRISALLKLEVDSQPIVFDSVLDPASRHFSIRSSEGV